MKGAMSLVHAYVALPMNVEGHSSDDDGIKGFHLKLLPKALPGLMGHEDEEMIGSLGRETIVDSCINGPLGWHREMCFL